MAKPPRTTDLRAKNAKRSNLITRSEKGLIKQSGSLQRNLNAFLLNEFLPSLAIDENTNTIRNTTANLKKVNNSAKLKKFIRDKVNPVLQKYYLTQFSKIENRTVSYFNEFDPTDATKKRLINRANTVADGFIDDLFSNNQVVKDIQDTFRKAVTAGMSVSELQNTITDQVKGRNDQMGIIENFQYNNGYNEFQKQARGLDEDFSQALNLNYALYAGTEIKTTRKFCLSRIGKVYNRETILSWQDLNWQGKEKNHQILIDLGGYNCRHDLDWMTFELAKRLNPNIEKSKFDKK